MMQVLVRTTLYFVALQLYDFLRRKSSQLCIKTIRDSSKNTKPTAFD